MKWQTFLHCQFLNVLGVSTITPMTQRWIRRLQDACIYYNKVITLYVPKCPPSNSCHGAPKLHTSQHSVLLIHCSKHNSTVCSATPDSYQYISNVYHFCTWDRPYSSISSFHTISRWILICSVIPSDQPSDNQVNNLRISIRRSIHHDTKLGSAAGLWPVL